MEKQKISGIMLPSYTKGEEVFNMTTHIVGGALGVAALVLCIIFSAVRKNPYGLAGSIVFGITLILLYTCSSVYHGLSPKLHAKKIFRIIDHCSIFLLIAGTYTPISLFIVKEYSSVLGWIVFGVLWVGAITGILLNCIDMEKYKIISALCYIIMGWSIVFAWKAFGFMIARGGIWLLVSGGIAYTVGAIFYYAFKKKKYMHSVFHIFTVAGSVFHILYIILYVI